MKRTSRLKFEVSSLREEHTETEFRKFCFT